MLMEGLQVQVRLGKDLDRLLEKRYKDWTLEEMNGI